MAEERPEPVGRETDGSEELKPNPVAPGETEADNAQEWGTRLDHGRAIARGGKTDGFVEGASEQ